MHFGCISLLPDMFSALDLGITGRAQKEGLTQLSHWNPRDFTEDKHRTVDDRPYGGGPGMVMKPEPLVRAISAAKETLPKAKVIYLSPQGKPFSQVVAKENLASEQLILLSGRYEGIDQRVIDKEVDEEWSLGDYVLSGGELAAMVIIDAMTRLVPGALGHADSADQDSLSNGLLEHPQYTRPEKFDQMDVPSVLHCGDHQKIARWQLKQALGQTWLKRPDLLNDLALTAEQCELLQEFIKEKVKEEDV